MSTPSDFKCGYVALVGRPNAGKSTLVNAWVGQKVAIVSPKPQTTRTNQLGVLTTNNWQVVFVDAPGLLRARHALDRVLVASAQQALMEADVVLWVADVSRLPAAEDERLAELVRSRLGGRKLLMVLNKADHLRAARVLPNTDAYRALAPDAEWMLVSALRGDNLERVLARIVELLPVGPQLFPEDQVTDKHLRVLAGELVREAALYSLHEEVPHGLAVVVEEYDETDPALVRIEAMVYVDNDRHKGIVIGQGGSMLKVIGSRARKEIEVLVERQVFLGLRVKVRDGWRSDEREVARMGYGDARELRSGEDEF